MKTRIAALPFALLAAVLCFVLPTASLSAQAQQDKPPIPKPPSDDKPAPEELNRGPIHEAFAQPVTLNAKPGLIIPRKPPELIEELPADQKPAGDNVAWIGGYWSWDEDRKDFLWISGTWRVLPEGRQWVPGYWNKAADGYQWVSGYWAAAAAEKAPTEYLPKPPDSLEVGPSSESPGDDYIWSPGYWGYHENRYIWRPGYWYLNSPGWIWSPPSYYWTPAGYSFCDGYWDYSFRRRGLCFASAYFPSGYYGSYSPSYCLDLDLVTDFFFVWPGYRHYCFGDYYGGSWFGFGIYPWFSFGFGRHGYCPIYNYYNCHYRNRYPHWNRHLRDDFARRRDDPGERPGRTVADARRRGNDDQNVARPIDQIAKRRDVKLEPLSTERRQIVQKEAGAVNKFRDQRAKVEGEGAGRLAGGKPGDAKPVKLDLPKSPVAGRPAAGGDDKIDTRRPAGSGADKTPRIAERPPARPTPGVKPDNTPRLGTGPRDADSPRTRVEPRGNDSPGVGRPTRTTDGPKTDVTSPRRIDADGPPRPSPRLDTPNRGDDAPRIRPNDTPGNAPRAPRIDDPTPRIAPRTPAIDGPGPRDNAAPRIQPQPAQPGPRVIGPSSSPRSTPSMPRAMPSSPGRSFSPPSRSFPGGGGGGSRIGGGGGGRIGGGGGGGRIGGGGGKNK